MTIAKTTFCIILVLLHVGNSMAKEKIQPYKGYTGTVHQLGVTGSAYITSNPNYSTEDHKSAFHDYGLGIVYNLHDYLTRQTTFEVISSITVATAESLESRTYDDNKQKITWPVDCRIYLGPSEDFQAYLGIGLQWSMLEKNTGEYDIVSGTEPSKTIHQLSGNTAIGLNILGPQKYMCHFNVGVKFHYTITDNDKSHLATNTTDLSKDRSCTIVNGSLTIDMDRRKKICAILNYEYPLGSPHSRYRHGNNGFFKHTQSVSLGVLFYLGGTRK